MTTCYSCEKTAARDDAPPWERIAEDDHWRVAHSFNTSLPGWLVLLPRRHVTRIAELTDDEAVGLGLWQVRLARALAEVTGCAKTYVAQFAEAKGHEHVHFHVVPRMNDLAADRRGPKIFAFLKSSEEERVSAEQMNALSEALGAAIAGDRAQIEG